MANCVIKADDFRGLASERWRKFFDHCELFEVPVAVGVIAREIAEGGSVDSGLISALHDGPYEVFNHGLMHSKDDPLGTTEFFGTPFDSQLHSLQHSQEVLGELFGRPPRIFGPPFNLFDANTLRALHTLCEIEILFDIPFLPKKLTIPKAYYVECEGPFSGRQFAVEVAKERGKTFTSAQRPFVLQIHPGNAWTCDCVTRFAEYVRYLQGCGYEFVLPDQFFTASTLSFQKCNGVTSNEP